MTKVRIKAEPILGKDLQPGDLFSTHGPSYWDQFGDGLAIGERVFIRTNAPSDYASDSELTVFRITIEKVGS